MKIRAFWSALLIICIASCNGNDPESQRPDDIIETEICPTLFARILELFPENIEIQQSILFNDTTQKKIELVKDTKVYVTYLAEGAGYRNSVVWYSYHKNSPPSSGSQLDLHPLFPDVSSDVLEPGNRLKLQDEEFPAGTIIGFALIINGWQGRIDYDRQKLYTDYKFNANKRQQHILFMEKNCGELCLAFEDNIAMNDDSDADYNDIIFTVSDNNSDEKNSSFNQKGIVSW